MTDPKHSKIVSGIHEIIGGPAPTEDEENGAKLEDALLRSPRAAIILATGVDRLNFMEPGEVFDRHIVGITVIDDQLAVVYNEQAVIGAIAATRKLDPLAAFDWFALKRGQSENELPAPIFMTDIRDVMV